MHFSAARQAAGILLVETVLREFHSTPSARLVHTYMPAQGYA